MRVYGRIFIFGWNAKLMFCFVKFMWHLHEEYSVQDALGFHLMVSRVFTMTTHANALSLTGNISMWNGIINPPGWVDDGFTPLTGQKSWVIMELKRLHHIYDVF